MLLRASLFLFLFCLHIVFVASHKSEDLTAKAVKDSHSEKSEKQRDHEAFLGDEDEAHAYDELSSKESKQRLQELVESQIDTDHDRIVSQEELQKWIADAAKKSSLEDRDHQWRAFGLGDKDNLSWKAYSIKTFGHESTHAKDHKESDKAREKASNRDNQRWKLADKNGDGQLDKEEFYAFLHPEHEPRMRQYIAKEALEDMDNNGDGVVDLDEYLNEVSNEERTENEMKWSMQERARFRSERDLNKNGVLDLAEVTKWLVPILEDFARNEADHLISLADDNKDKQLSMEEILKHYDVFVGSQSTEFGSTLDHEEL